MDVCADALVGDKRDGGAGGFERVKCGRGGKTGCTGWQKADPAEAWVKLTHCTRMCSQHIIITG